LFYRRPSTRPAPCHGITPLCCAGFPSLLSSPEYTMLSPEGITSTSPLLRKPSPPTRVPILSEGRSSSGLLLAPLDKSPQDLVSLTHPPGRSSILVPHHRVDFHRFVFVFGLTYLSPPRFCLLMITDMWRPVLHSYIFASVEFSLPLLVTHRARNYFCPSVPFLLVTLFPDVMSLRRLS